jgi:hypothetical protein
MNYMLLIIGFSEAGQEKPTGGGQGHGPTVEEFQTYDKALVDAGVKVDGSALDDFRSATTVQVDGSGQRIVTNGPFGETGEFVGGYLILDLPDLDAALDWAARCPGAKYGRVEVRPLAYF